MRATSIVRRIDDLGRIVIPKEIRRTMGIKEGEPLEIYTDTDCVYFKKYTERKSTEILTDFKRDFGADIPSDAYNLITAAINIINNGNK